MCVPALWFFVELVLQAWARLVQLSGSSSAMARSSTRGCTQSIGWAVTERLLLLQLPYKGINALEFAMEATSLIQQRFYETFPKTADEERYLYA